MTDTKETHYKIQQTKLSAKKSFKRKNVLCGYLRKNESKLIEDPDIVVKNRSRPKIVKYL